MCVVLARHICVVSLFVVLLRVASSRRSHRQAEVLKGPKQIQTQRRIRHTSTRHTRTAEAMDGEGTRREGCSRVHAQNTAPLAPEEAPPTPATPSTARRDATAAGAQGTVGRAPARFPSARLSAPSPLFLARCCVLCAPLSAASAAAQLPLACPGPRRPASQAAAQKTNSNSAAPTQVRGLRKTEKRNGTRKMKREHMF
jgi:hypothetical protein